MMTDTAGTRTRDRSDDEPWVVAGVDTHKDTHHVAVLNAATGAGLGDMRVPATRRATTSCTTSSAPAGASG